MIEVMERIDTRSFCATPAEASPANQVELRVRLPNHSGGGGRGKRVPMLPWSQTLFSDNVSEAELMVDEFAGTAEPSSPPHGLPEHVAFLPAGYWIR
jgi:hypothetical protein